MWGELLARQSLLARTAAAHVALFAVCVVLGVVDSGEVMGVNRWVKPQKFTLSVAIYLASMAWYWPVAKAAERAKARAAGILAGTLIFEIVVILGQAARGVRSHFNNDTPADALLFALMGVAIVVNIATAAVVLRWTLRAEGSPYVWGVRLGLLLFVVFSLEGGLMAQRLAHAVGVADGGPGLPFVNWSTTGGDLRVAHFVGMHALQVLPVAGHMTRSTPVVAILCIVWTAISTAALWRALTGVPPI
jgi:multisubunit Na+/H+ antiporter MnhC subunit